MLWVANKPQLLDTLLNCSKIFTMHALRYITTKVQQCPQ